MIERTYCHVCGASRRNAGALATHIRYCADTQDRLARRSRREGACLIWTGQRTTRDYGVTFVGGRRWSVHRLAWTLQNGEIPAGLFVLHRCDRPLCFEHSHLFLGTHTDNMRDCAAKGRYRLQKHPELSAVLSDARREHRNAEKPTA